MERSDFLIGAFRSGILARGAQRQDSPALPCLYPYVIQAKPLVVSERKFELSSQIRSLLSINAQLTPSCRKKNSEIFCLFKNNDFLCPCRNQLIKLLTFKILQLCRNLLFPLKKNRLVVMLCRLILSILWMVLEIILSEFLRWVLLLLWIRLKKKTNSLNLKLKLMKSNNIWKVVIGAISAALGYILNAIGL
nr:MAG TPA: hypothetical protein [Microviridae sp.]